MTTPWRSVHDAEKANETVAWQELPSALKELDPIPQFKATAKLGEFLEAQFSKTF